MGEMEEKKQRECEEWETIKNDNGVGKDNKKMNHDGHKFPGIRTHM